MKKPQKHKYENKEALKTVTNEKHCDKVTSVINVQSVLFLLFFFLLIIILLTKIEALSCL